MQVLRPYNVSHCYYNIVIAVFMYVLRVYILLYTHVHIFYLEKISHVRSLFLMVSFLRGIFFYPF